MANSPACYLQERLLSQGAVQGTDTTAIWSLWSYSGWFTILLLVLPDQSFHLQHKSENYKAPIFTPALKGHYRTRISSNFLVGLDLVIRSDDKVCSDRICSDRISAWSRLEATFTQSSWGSFLRKRGLNVASPWWGVNVPQESQGKLGPTCPATPQVG